MNKTKVLLKETLQGKTIGRTLINLEFSNITLSGRGIDLGAKSNNASYYRFVKIEEDTEIIYTDLNPKNDDVLEVNLEDKIPVPDDSQDFLILSNVLEHVYEYQNCISETYRVLKKTGRLIGAVPFLHQIHYDPDDFFRYTESSLKKMFIDNGFTKVEIIPLGFGPFSTAASLYGRLFRFRFLISAIYLLMIGIDVILNKFYKNNNSVKASNFPLRYFFICTK